MDKLKSYFGLIFTIFLGWVFLSPQSLSMYHGSINATPLDRTLISGIVQGSRIEFKLLGRVEYVRRCTRGPDTVYSGRCGIHVTAPDQLEMLHMRWQFEKYDRGFSDAVYEYFDTDYGDPSSDQKLTELQKRALATYPALMEDIRSSYQVTVYALHALFALILVLIAVFRKNVGAALIWPVAFILKLIIRAARKAHEKV